MTLFENIKKDLPNFPNEIIEDWLLPIANDIGWSSKHQRWEGILLCKTIEFWQAKKWEKQNIDLNKIIFSQDTIEIFNGLYEAHILIQDNLYSKIKNGQKRYLEACKYIIQNGRFPKPICLLFEEGRYSIVDGNHRFFAWQRAKKIISIKKYNIKLNKQNLNKQEVWVAC